MASYLSYFTSGTSLNASAPYPNSQASTPGATWSSTFSSRIATLRKALTKDSEEDDPDNEDCSHVSNVLRAYYTEKGRSFPEWLPPDPKKPVAPPPQLQNQYGQYGNAYGNQNQYGAPPVHGRDGSGGRGGLSDLWDSSPAPAAPPAQSLRATRPTPQALRSHDSRSHSSERVLTSSSSQRGSGARPLPSQREGSYQNTPSAGSSGLGSKDRLRARLQGGGSGRSSPALSNSGGQTHYGPSGGSYDSQGSGGGPHVSASEPWSSGNNPYASEPNYNNPPAKNPYGRQRPGGPR